MVSVISKKFSIMTKAKNMREGFTLVAVSAIVIVLAYVHEELLQGQDFLGI